MKLQEMTCVPFRINGDMPVFTHFKKEAKKNVQKEARSQNTQKMPLKRLQKTLIQFILM